MVVYGVHGSRGKLASGKATCWINCKVDTWGKDGELALKGKEISAFWDNNSWHVVKGKDMVRSFTAKAIEMAEREWTKKGVTVCEQCKPTGTDPCGTCDPVTRKNLRTKLAKL